MAHLLCKLFLFIYTLFLSCNFYYISGHRQDSYIDPYEGQAPDGYQSSSERMDCENHSNFSMTLTLAVLIDRTYNNECEPESQSAEGGTSYSESQEFQSSHEFYTEMVRDNALDAGRESLKFDAMQGMAGSDSKEQIEVPRSHRYRAAQLSRIMTENADLLHIYQTCNCGDTARIEARLEKIEQIFQGNIILSHQAYELSSDAIGLLSKERLDPMGYFECSGDQFQQAIHQECIGILEKLALPNQDILVKEYMNSMLHLVDAARESNQSNSPIEAMSLTNVCWSILDCIKAAGEGIIEGTISTVVNHPIEATLCICAPQYLLAYHVGKIAYAYLDIKIACLMDQEAGAQKLVDYMQPFISCVDAISEGDITLRGSVKLAATVATQVVVQGKVQAGFKIFYETTKKRAKNYLKNNPAATAQQYLATADGRILQAAGGPGKNTLNLRDVRGKGTKNSGINTEKSVLTFKNMQEFFESKFGMELKRASDPTSRQWDGQTIFKLNRKLNKYGLKKGDQFYLDAVHKDHLEVFNKRGKFKTVLNLDGTENILKREAAKNRKI